MAQEGLLDALGAGGSDALVDGERLLQAGDAFMLVAVLRNRHLDGAASYHRGRRQAVYQYRGYVLRISVIVCGDSNGVVQISQ
jgi:hypothetical protein